MHILTEVNWNKAPVGATYYNENNGLFYREGSRGMAQQAGYKSDSWLTSGFKNEELHDGAHPGFYHRSCYGSQE